MVKNLKILFNEMAEIQHFLCNACVRIIMFLKDFAPGHGKGVIKCVIVQKMGHKNIAEVLWDIQIVTPSIPHKMVCAPGWGEGVIKCSIIQMGGGVTNTAEVHLDRPSLRIALCITSLSFGLVF